MRAIRFLFLACSGWSAIPAQTLVTLSPTTSPAAGAPGVTNINLTGSNFPAGSILPASTTVTLNPASGTGTSATTAATAVTTILGTTRRVTFAIPFSISVSVPTAYLATLSGTTTTGTAFASSNQAALTINPGAAISFVNPSSGQQGQQNLVVTITGQGTNFVQGVTQANFGPGISVGGGAAGTFGPVTVANSTTATATLSIAASAALGARAVTAQTASEQASLGSGFSVSVAAPIITQVSPASGQQGQALTSVAVTGAFTHFTQATPAVTFSAAGITASAVHVIDDTHLTLTVTIAANAPTGLSNITVMTGAETATGTGLFAVGTGAPTITQVSPAVGQQGQTLTGVVITGASTHFTQAMPAVTFSGTGVTASAVQVIDNTHLTVTLAIAATAVTGPSNITVVTGAETATGIGLFTVVAGTPVITSISPPTGRQGQTLTGVVITGSFTHFTQATPVVTFSTAGVTASLVQIADNTHVTVSVTIAANAAIGVSNVTVTTGPETATGIGLFSVTTITPIITQVNPSVGQQGQQNLAVAITGQFTHFAQGATVANFGTGITVNSTTVTDATHATVNITIASSATPGLNTVIMTTGTEVVGLVNGFTITNSTPVITQVSPNSGQQGQILTGVAITGAFTHFTQATPTVTFSNTGVVASNVQVMDNTHLSVTLTIAAGAAAGGSNVTVVTGTESASGPSLFTVTSAPVITQVNPNSGQQGQTLTGVAITGALTHFTQGTPTVTFSNTGVVASNIQVTDNTHLTATLTISAGAAAGSSNVTVVTGVESASGFGLFTVASAPVITQVNPNIGQQGQTLTGVAITGALTHFTQGTPTVTFSNTGVVASNIQVTDNTHLTATLTISAGAPAGGSNVTVVTGVESASGVGLFTVASAPVITQVNPNSGQQGQTLTGVAITGALTHFTQSPPTVTFSNTGIVASGVSVTDNTHLIATLTIAATAPTGASNVTVVTGAETATGMALFTVAGALPTITDFNPKSAPVGRLVTITGTNLQPNQGTAAQVMLAKQSGGTIAGAVSSAAATSLSFVIPAGAATGTLSVTVNGNSTSAAVPLTIVPASTFTLTALPSPANLIQGQSTAYAVSVSSTTGFNQLAALSVTGMPSGITAAFQPQQITAGQTSVLTMSAPAGQAASSSTLTVSASAVVNGISVVQNTPVTLNVQPVTTSFLGRTVVSDSLETTLVGVTIKMLGLDGNGNTTGCTGGAVSDGGGNFLMTNLPPICVGPQLISFDGTTVTSPSGKYAGVNLVFTFASGQVTVSPVLVHLPRIDTVETFYVTQNAASNQSYSFTTIPGLSVTVYAGTTFTLADGTQPNPFPLAAVQVPVDRLPDAKPQVPTMMRVFIVAFQPANATTNEPVAVFFPNTLNTPPGTDMALMTLDPTHGQMVPYGTGSVNSNGTQIAPDADPAHPGHLYGLVHFDWHGPMPPPPPGSNPAPPGSGTSLPGGGGGACSPGAGPGGGPGPGGTCGVSSDGTAEAGDPVDLFSGTEVIKNTDISISGSRGSLALVRTYRSLSGNPGPFGIGTGHNYSLQLNTDFLIRSGEGVIPIVMPDGNQFLFTLTEGSFTNTTIPALSGAVLSNPSSGNYTLRWRNGTTYVFQNSALGGLEAYLTAIIDANGNKISMTLNPSQPLQVTQITDAVGRSLTLTYDGSNRITSISDPIGRTVQYTYNAQGTLATVTDPAGGITKYTYDANNNLMTITDPRGILQAQNTLDSVGRVTKQVRPDGGTLMFSYAFLNPDAPSSQVMQAQVTDSAGVEAIFRFNPNGFVTDVTATGGQHRQMTRAAGTNLLTSVTEASSTQTYTYDANGNVLSSTDATGLTTQFTYNSAFNKVTSITDPLGNVSRFTYDGNGNLLTSADADGHASSYQYDPTTGLLLQATDPLNQKTTFAYDGFGNLITTTDPVGNTTSYAYDGISRLIQIKDSLGRVTSFTYDPLGRLLTRPDAKSGVTAFTYDLNGNLLSVKDARNNTTTFAYDVMNRLTTRTNPLGQTDTRMYDTNGNLVKFVDRRGQTSTFSYDNLNRLVGESYQDSTVTRTYDVLGRPAQVNDSAGGVFGFSYDPVGRLTSSTTPFGTVNYTYDGRGAMASRQVAGQPALSYSYDPAWNLTAAALPEAAATFAYSPRNQVLKETRLNGVSSSFTYDSDARLVSLAHTIGASVIDNESYSYDAVGNRASHSTSIAQPLITQPSTNQYDAANKLTQFGSVSDSYDANGNLIQDGTGNTYTWDSRNRVTSIVTAAGQTTNFTYDFSGNLIEQADAGTNLNLTKTFVLDSLTNVAYESASDGSSFSVLSGRSIDSHLAIAQSSGQVQYGLPDAINSTVATVDQTGAIKSQFLYDPYGQTTTTGTYPFQFTGRMPVTASLYYYRARFYNSQTGRFISGDPIGFAGGPNLYSYVRNNPTNFADSTGLCAVYVEKPDHSGVVCAVNSPSDPSLLNPIVHQAPTNPVMPPAVTSGGSGSSVGQTGVPVDGGEPYGPWQPMTAADWQRIDPAAESLGLGPLDPFLPSPNKVLEWIDGVKMAWETGWAIGCWVNQHLSH